MKPITTEKWLSMNLEKRSWIVCRAKGIQAKIYWHCVAPDGVKISGSMGTKKRVDDMIDTARKLTKKEAARIPCQFPHPFATCEAKPSQAFPHYAEHEHIALSLIPEIISKHGSVKLFETIFGMTASAGDRAATTDSLTTSVCLLFLRLEKAIVDQDEN